MYGSARRERTRSLCRKQDCIHTCIHIYRGIFHASLFEHVSAADREVPILLKTPTAGPSQRAHVASILSCFPSIRIFGLHTGSIYPFQSQGAVQPNALGAVQAASAGNASRREAPIESVSTRHVSQDILVLQPDACTMNPCGLECACACAATWCVAAMHRHRMRDYGGSHIKGTHRGLGSGIFGSAVCRCLRLEDTVRPAQTSESHDRSTRARASQAKVNKVKLSQAIVCLGPFVLHSSYVLATLIPFPFLCMSCAKFTSRHVRRL